MDGICDEAWKIVRQPERFHGTERRELLNATVFDSKAHAQQVIDAWVSEYSTDRPPVGAGRG